MVLLRRPSSFDEGIEQLTTAVRETKPTQETTSITSPPRARVWRACHRLLSQEFIEGLRVLYEANAIVAFLFNTIVPHFEERLRYDTLQSEYDRAAGKPDAVRQNEARLHALLEALAEAEGSSRLKTVDPAFARMRDAMSALHRDTEIRVGLNVLYICSKTARGALDLIIERLVQAYRNDTSIVPTSDIPMAAMLLR